MAVNVIHTDAKGFGLLSSIMAVGTISGALLAAGRDKPQFGSLFIGAVVFALGSAPIGAPIVGWVANRFGPRWALGVGAASGFAAAVVAVRVLMQRTESIPENEPRPI
jgi:MFS family permease